MCVSCARKALEPFEPYSLSYDSGTTHGFGDFPKKIDYNTPRDALMRDLRHIIVGAVGYVLLALAAACGGTQ